MKRSTPVYFSKVATKIFHRILLAELISLLIFFLVSYLFLWPMLLKKSVEKSHESLTALTLAVNNYVADLDKQVIFIQNSSELEHALSRYNANKSEETRSAVALCLHMLASDISYIRSVVMISEDGEYFDSLVGLKDADRAYLNEHMGNPEKHSNIYGIQATPETYTMCHTRTAHIARSNYTFYYFYRMNSLVDSCNSLSRDTFDSYKLYRLNSDVAYETESSAFAPEVIASSDPVISNSDGYYFIQAVPELHWKFVAHSSVRNVSSQIINIYVMILLFAAFIFLLLLFLLVPTVNKVINPLQELNATMQRATRENINVYSSIATDDEIGELSDTYNHLLDTLKEHIEYRIETDKNMYKVQYNLLAAQIDSHFIYNTMSIINILCGQGHNKEAIEVNTALTAIMQNCLRVKTLKITDTIRQELFILKQYHIIEKKRYDNYATLSIDVPESLLDQEIPKNLLQPIVENSFRHGLYDEETGEIHGTVTLKIYTTGDALIIHIYDDGIGASPEVIEILNSPGSYENFSAERGKHIGLANIYERIKYIYHDDAAIEFSSDNGFSTLIFIKKSAISSVDMDSLCQA